MRRKYSKQQNRFSFLQKCLRNNISQLYSTYFLSTLKCEPSSTIKASATFGAENEHLMLGNLK